MDLIWQSRDKKLNHPLGKEELFLEAMCSLLGSVVDKLALLLTFKKYYFSLK